MTPEEYQAKRDARYDRLLLAADKAQRAGDSSAHQGNQMFSFIPMGQPILVGHYSEQRDRNYRERAHNKLRKGFELHQRAETLRQRAESMKDNTAIFSDDPQAQEKIEDRIARLEKRQDLMRTTNKLIRKDDDQGLLDMGFSEALIAKLKKGDFCGRTGFADFELSNNSANIRRLKDRLKVIARHAEDETTEKKVNGVTMIDNVEDNRLQLYFPGKPSEAIRGQLKHAGFRWTPTLGCWQAYRNHNAKYYADQIVNSLEAANETHPV